MTAQTSPNSTPGGAKGKKTAINIIKLTAIDLAVGGVLGGAAGAALGRWSLLGGLAANSVGHFINQPLLNAFGVGMIASGIYETGVSGPDDVLGLEGAKERVIAFANGLKQKAFLDKILPASKQVSGLGEVQYFNYTDDAIGAIDMSALDRIEAQVNANAEQFASSRQISGLGDVYGLGGSLDDPLY